ncbi:unnamed protein product [Sphagnum jensenii]|uniref:Uncharacterized protein n=1 Tax=Sphagnum jensenii TaxID=128206 RepID=A0ABP1B5A9_9BRYO
MARPSFVKPSVLVLTILCLSQLLAATEAPADGDTTYHAKIVDYELGGRNNRWFVTWVFQDSMSIQMSNPSSLGCFDIQINLLGPDIINEVESKENGASSCGLPPDCSPPPDNAAAGAAVATNFISKQLLKSANLCGFQMFELTYKDSLAHSAENWVTITIKPQGVLVIESATNSAEIGYVPVEVTFDGVVTLESSNSSTPRAAGSFGVEIPAISSVA